MSKAGQVTITLEPHIFEATMYLVKDPKLRQQQKEAQQKHKQLLQQHKQQQKAAQQQHQQYLQQQRQLQQQQQMQQQQHYQQQHFQPPQARPIVQHGLPNNGMAHPVPHMSATSSPGLEPRTASASPVPQRIPSNEPERSDGPKLAAAPPTQAPAKTTAPTPNFQPRPPPAATPPATATPPANAPKAATTPAAAARPPTNPPAKPANAGPSQQAAPAPAKPAPASGPAGKPNTAAPAAKPATNDPVIALLAQRASGDPELRDLMKRVAVGQAKQEELNHFQTIINQLNAEYKRGGGQQGPSADRLLVDGRTVRYFADEVCAILDKVLAANPNQKAADLKPPPRSDALVVMLVKAALDDERTKNMCRRISTGKPGFTDSTDLKDMLDRLHRQQKQQQQPQQQQKPPQPQQPQPQPQPQQKQPPAQQQVRQHPQQLSPAPMAPHPQQLQQQQQQQPRPLQPPLQGHLAHPPMVQAPLPPAPKQPNPQTIRSKVPMPPLPPPPLKSDVTQVLFDLGTGDRYLFPKNSILEYLPATSGQQVVASFLVVRKGNPEYGADPDVEYYQPVTMRLSTSSGRHLENLAKVVAPQDEVRRHMDEVMDNKMRAQYALLAMRLPRVVKEEGAEDEEEVKKKTESSATPQPQPKAPEEEDKKSVKPQVLWMTSAKRERAEVRPRYVDPEEEAEAQYLKLINSVAARG